MKKLLALSIISNIVLAMLLFQGSRRAQLQRPSVLPAAEPAVDTEARTVAEPPWQEQAESQTEASRAQADSVESTNTQAAALKPKPWLLNAPTPRYPLVFQMTNSEALELNEATKAILQQLQQQFVEDIGGPNQDPSDPAYLTRWLKASARADDMLRGLLGSQFYLNYQLQAENRRKGN